MASQSGLNDRSHWMGDLPSHLHKVPINGLAIPGSHDSFTYTLQRNSDLGPDLAPAIRDFVAAMGKMGKDVVYNWSVTQALTCTEQLAAGIRYFDIRLATKPGSEDLFSVHGLYGGNIKYLLAEIHTFLDAHPSEIVFLDFNHFYNITDEMHAKMIAHILEKFGSKLCGRDDPRKLTLETLWERKQQVLVFYHSPTCQGHLQLWPGDDIPVPWPNVTKLEKLLTILSENYNKKRSDTSFYGTQGILTPDGAAIFAHLTSNLKDAFASKVNPAIVTWLSDKQASTSLINFVITDFVDMVGVIDATLKLNHN